VSVRSCTSYDERAQRVHELESPMKEDIMAEGISA